MFIICAEQFQILTVDNFGLDILIWTDRRTNMYHIANVTAISSLTKIAFQKCFKATSKYLFPEHYLCTLFYSKLHVFYLHRNVHQLLTNFQSVIYNNGHVNTHSQSIMLFPSPPRVLIQKQAYLSYRFIFSIPSQYCKKTNLCP